MSTRQYLVDAAAKHQVYLQRYAGGINKQLVDYINTLRRQTIELLKNSTDLSMLDKRRNQQLIDGLRDLSNALTKDLVSGVKGDLQNLAKYEAGFTERLITNSTSLDTDGFQTVMPTVGQLKAAAFTNVMDATVPGMGTSGGITVQKALETFGRKQAATAVQAIRNGFALGKTITDVTKDIVEGLGQGVNYNAAKAVARTVTNHVSSAARSEFYQNNTEIITGYQVVATLDDRTTLTCASLDGQVFAKDDFNAPPYHWNCRTTFIGVVDPKYSLNLSGTRVAKGDTTSTVSTQTTYNSFLGRQSEKFQNDVLGQERAALYRAGLSDVKSFVDHNYTPLSLNELRTKDNEHVFAKAEKELGRSI